MAAQPDHQHRRRAALPAPPKLKPPHSRPNFFSCSFFRHCAQSPLSPTPTPTPPPSAAAAAPPPESTSESSSSSASQSFTQWRFPPTFHHPPTPPPPLDDSPPNSPPQPSPAPPPPPIPPEQPRLPSLSLQELFHVAELQFTAGSDGDRLAALHMLEQHLLRNSAAASDTVVPAAVINGVVEQLNKPSGAKSATKVLLALCLDETHRRAAVEQRAAGGVVEALSELSGAAAERALAALELLCTVAEGAAEVRAHALAVPALVAAMGRMEGRGREYAIGVLAAVFGGGGEAAAGMDAPPEQVARAVELAMKGECSARGRRKGAQLLKALQEGGRLNV